MKKSFPEVNKREGGGNFAYCLSDTGRLGKNRNPWGIHDCWKNAWIKVSQYVPEPALSVPTCSATSSLAIQQAWPPGSRPALEWHSCVTWIRWCGKRCKTPCRRPPAFAWRLRASPLVPACAWPHTTLILCLTHWFDLLAWPCTCPVTVDLCGDHWSLGWALLASLDLPCLTCLRAVGLCCFVCEVPGPACLAVTLSSRLIFPWKANHSCWDSIQKSLNTWKHLVGEIQILGFLQISIMIRVNCD